MPRCSLAVFAVAVLALAGCGSSNSSSTASSATATTTPNARTAARPTAFIAPFTTVSTLGSTVPGNGDVNPYGLVFVPSSVGKLQAGDLLVSNFNDKANDQGTGTTIDQLTTAGSPTRSPTASRRSRRR